MYYNFTNTDMQYKYGELEQLEIVQIIVTYRSTG